MKRKVSTTWSGQAFIGKVWAPLLLFASSALAATGTNNLGSFIFFLLVGVPLAMAGLFFFLIPAQLRVEGASLLYRRWLQWNTIPLGEVESFEAFFVGFGVAKFLGQPKRLIFFLEPENRYLLKHEQRASRRPNRESEKKLPTIVRLQGKGRYQALAVMLGVACEIIMQMALPPLPPIALVRGPNWLAHLYKFGSSHEHTIAAFGVAGLVIFLRASWLSAVDRLGVLFMIGLAVAAMFI